MRYFLQLAYNGEKYHGWQSQPNAPSVQETLENALQTILRHPVSVVGAGRTDAGVHAAEMYAHFDSEKILNGNKSFLSSLNHLLGADIAVYNVILVEDERHARFDAVKRTYKYFISYRKNPFLYPFSLFSHRKLDLEKMNEGASLLLGISDFTSFAKLHSDAKTNICKVFSAEWNKVDEPISILSTTLPFNGIVFTISADRFLRNMVRAIVGTLIDLGTGKISIEKFKNIIDTKDRCAAGFSVPASGLFLWKIEYPFINQASLIV